MKHFQAIIMKSILLLIALIPIALMLFGQSLTLDQQKEINQLLHQYEGNRPGYTLGIVQDGELVYSKGYGMANLSYHIPISDSAAFYIGSMAKQFTAAALLILEEKGKVDFNRPVQHYLNDFPSYDKEITFHHLIHHISGIRGTSSMQLF